MQRIFHEACGVVCVCVCVEGLRGSYGKGLFSLLYPHPSASALKLLQSLK